MDTAPQTPQAKTLLRFLTCGSVDDGKSTLIGRLLYDTKLIFDDQLASVTRASRRHGTTGEEPDLALLVDGLEAERQQGITIDVAYRFFTTKRRSFIVADTPGHEQYTRNMATGASTADVAILLIDARKGLLPQTRRHSKICALLGIRHVVMAVNKIDLVDAPEAVFNGIVAQYRDFAASLGFASITPIPVSARYGDNVSTLSERTPWYRGPALLAHLEEIDVSEDRAAAAFRFPVQWVNRPNLDFRGFSGTIAAGQIAVGDTVVVAGSGRSSRVTRIVTFDGDLPSAEAGQAVTLVLADEIDVIRGDVLAHERDRPEVADQFAAHVVWMSDETLLPGRSYLLKCGTATVPARVTTLKHRIDITDLSTTNARTLALNEIGAVNIATDQPIAFDPYASNRRMGAFILIDRATNATAGAGMIDHGLRRATNIHRQAHAIGRPERARAMGQTPGILWFTGLSGSGKSTIADLVEQELTARGLHAMLLDGDNLRHGLNRDLGFTDADRVENIRRVGEVAKLMVEAGLVVICCFISPFAAERDMVRGLVEGGAFAEIFVDTPVAECIRRDPKGLYAKALAGQIPNFTGIGSRYEAPLAPELRIDGTLPAQDAAALVVDWVMDRQSRDRL
jgi:bifunctional enzyme CysN/CysC